MKRLGCRETTFFFDLASTKGFLPDNLLFFIIKMSAFGSYKISKIINRKLPLIMIF